MSLEEWWKYETVSWNKVRMQWSFELEEMMMYYESELSEILNISNKSEEEREKILRNQKVVYGLIDNFIMPSGRRHAETGKCLWGNTGWVMWSGDALKKKLQKFDIKIDPEEKI